MEGRTLAALTATVVVMTGLSAPAYAADHTPTSSAEPGWVTDELGTHEIGLASPGEKTDTTTGGVIISDLLCQVPGYGGGFNTSLGAGWSSLTRREGACRAAPAHGAHTTGEFWYVAREGDGELICRVGHMVRPVRSGSTTVRAMAGHGPVGPLTRAGTSLADYDI